VHSLVAIEMRGVQVAPAGLSHLGQEHPALAAERPVVEWQGQLIMVDDERMRIPPGQSAQSRMVRFRTLGCYPLSGAMESNATSLEAIVAEMIAARTSERGGRLIDRESSSSMEKKKREGYF